MKSKGMLKKIRLLGTKKRVVGPGGGIPPPQYYHPAFGGCEFQGPWDSKNTKLKVQLSLKEIHETRLIEQKTWDGK